MRDSLSRLLFDYSRQPGQSLEEARASISCGALVEVLGACSYQDHEKSVLKVLLEPYLRVASAPWVDRPLDEQENVFENPTASDKIKCVFAKITEVIFKMPRGTCLD